MLLHAPCSRRLFVGVMLDSATQAAVCKHRQDWKWPSRQEYWLTDPDRLHMTLHLPEQVIHTREPAMRAALRDVPMEPLELTLGIPMAWSHGIAVLLPEEHPGLRALHDRIEYALRVAGFASHSHWTPHVTLARNAMHAKPPATSPTILWTVREYMLIWSQLRPAFPKARYVVLEKYGPNPGKPSKPFAGGQISMAF